MLDILSKLDINIRVFIDIAVILHRVSIDEIRERETANHNNLLTISVAKIPNRSIQRVYTDHKVVNATESNVIIKDLRLLSFWS